MNEIARTFHGLAPGEAVGSWVRAEGCEEGVLV